MTKSLIKEKIYLFALEIIGLYKILLKRNEYVLSKQLLKSGTSIGANVSTEELHQLVKTQDASIGYTTVYRTLKLFVE